MGKLNATINREKIRFKYPQFQKNTILKFVHLKSTTISVYLLRSVQQQAASCIIVSSVVFFITLRCESNKFVSVFRFPSFSG